MKTKLVGNNFYLLFNGKIYVFAIENKVANYKYQISSEHDIVDFDVSYLNFIYLDTQGKVYVKGNNENYQLINDNTVCEIKDFVNLSNKHYNGIATAVACSSTNNKGYIVVGTKDGDVYIGGAKVPPINFNEIRDNSTIKKIIAKNDKIAVLSSKYLYVTGNVLYDNSNTVKQVSSLTALDTGRVIDFYLSDRYLIYVNEFGEPYIYGYFMNKYYDNKLIEDIPAVNMIGGNNNTIAFVDENNYFYAINLKYRKLLFDKVYELMPMYIKVYNSVSFVNLDDDYLVVGSFFDDVDNIGKFLQIIIKDNNIDSIIDSISYFVFDNDNVTKIEA